MIWFVELVAPSLHEQVINEKEDKLWDEGAVGRGGGDTEDNDDVNDKEEENEKSEIDDFHDFDDCDDDNDYGQGLCKEGDVIQGEKMMFNDK